jgi:cell division protein FtsQ
VRRVEIEEKVPDTLRIRIVERTPVALVANDGPVRYVDDDGVTFADVSPAVGDADLPVISGARDAELAHCVALLRDLRANDPQLYARVSEVRPLAPHGFAIFDRELGAFIYANAGQLSAKVRELHAIVSREKLARGAIEYADLRFENRIIVKPWRAEAMPPPSQSGSVAAALQD